MPAVADDSGLGVEVLSGEPGVESARYAGEEQNDRKNIEKLLNKLEGNKNRRARFVTVAVYYKPDGTYFKAEGEVRGVITEELRGEGGFGYDPVFQSNVYDKTMAELSLKEKNAISHRGQAFRRLKELILASFDSKIL